MLAFDMLRTARQGASINHIVSRFKGRWSPHFEELLLHADPVSRNIIKSTVANRHLISLSGAYVPIMLDVFSYDLEPNKSDVLSSIMNLSIGIFDDATEGLDSPSRANEFNWLESVMNGEGVANPDDGLQNVRQATRYLLGHVVSAIPSSYKARFADSVHQCNQATLEDDDKTKPDLELRANLGRTYGRMNYLVVESQLGSTVRPLQGVFESLFAGGAIIDDMADVCDDRGIKMTKPVSMLNGLPVTISAIVRSGIIPTSLADADAEFQKGIDICPNTASKRKFQETVNLIKTAYTVNLFRRYVRHTYGFHI